MPVLYSLPDAAKSLGGISVWTLRKHVANGRVRVTRIGRRVFLDGEELERIRREGLPSLKAAETVLTVRQDQIIFAPELDREDSDLGAN